MKSVWNIYVPSYDDKYVYYDHNPWLDEVLKVSSGYTALSGQGVYKGNRKTYREGVIQYTLTAHRHEVERLAKLVKTMFNQESVLYYKVSDDFHFI